MEAPDGGARRALHAVVAPNLIGTSARGHWSGDRPFTLSEEAAHVVDLIDRHAGPVHLVGHSYGGGVALRAACKRPTRIASLSLYEPTLFYVLKSMGPEGSAALEEIRAIARAMDHGIVSGAYRAAGEAFVDYWNGPGAWARLKPEAQAEFVRYAPKGCLDFRALIDERLPLSAYRRLRIPNAAHGGRTRPRANGADRQKAVRGHDRSADPDDCRRRPYGSQHPRRGGECRDRRAYRGEPAGSRARGAQHLRSGGGLIVVFQQRLVGAALGGCVRTRFPCGL